MKRIKNLVAFTLAETLIVMGIIGIVGVLVIPNVNKNTGRAESVAKLKKIHAELNQTHKMAEAKYGPVATWFNDDSSCADNSTCIKARYFNRITEFMKLQKNCGCKDGGNNLCGVTATSGCMSNSYSYLSSYSPWLYADLLAYPRAIAAGGWSFRVSYMYKNYTSSTIYNGYQFNKSAGDIYLDIDGPNKGKNTWGIDMFHFVITSDGVYPHGGGTFWTDEGTYNIKKYCFYYGYCAEWVIRNSNMDYIDTNHDSVDNAGICKNGKQLSTTVSSCK